jgi:hypothetical protein
MTMYWIYNYPNWTLGTAAVTLIVGLSLVGLYASRPLVRKLLGGSPVHNDIVSYFFAGVGVFYGLAMGLIAVATWEDFTGVDDLVGREAAGIVGLYRDFDGYPQPLRGRLERALRDYTRAVIDKDWPAHRRGMRIEETNRMLDDIENEIMAFEPQREREKIVHAEVLRSLDSVVEQRRLRLEAVDTGLPAALWAVVLIGAILNIVPTYVFWVENRGLHVLLVAILATFIALLIFLIAAMDNPFRGEFSVAPDAFQEVLSTVMSSTKAPGTP